MLPNGAKFALSAAPCAGSDGGKQFAWNSPPPATRPYPVSLISPTLPRMQPPESSPSPRRNPVLRALRLTVRVAVIIIITYGFGWVLNKSATSADARPQAAGFGK